MAAIKGSISNLQRPHQQLLLLHQAHAHGEEGTAMSQAGQLKDVEVLPVQDLQGSSQCV